MIKFVVFATLAAVAVAKVDLNVHLGGLPMQNPDLFQGDILGFDPDDRNVIPYTQMRWPGAKVPYVIDSSLAAYTSLIEQSMADYHAKTCVRFNRRTFENNYIRLFAGQGCYSNVGMVGGQQQLSLGQGCMYVGTIVHELGHALGFFHEQNRSDRDQFLIIYWNNIQSGMESQFALLKPHENILINAFDPHSIMCYGEYAFSRDRSSKTMEHKFGVRLQEPYDKAGLVNSDIQRVRTMYNCA